MMKLNNKTVIITGASKGLGKATAIKFAINGAVVVLSSRDKVLLKKLEKEINEYYGKAISVPADVTKEKDVINLMKTVYQKFKRIDILINNAGIWINGPIYDMKTEEWDKVIDTNLKGMFLCSREVSRYMIKQKFGHIINISSVAGKVANKNSTIYCASKFGVMGLSKSLSKDLKKYGIKTTIVCPSAINTNLFKGKPHVPKKLMMSPEKVSNIIYDVAIGKKKKDVIYIVKLTRVFRFMIKKIFRI